MLCVSRREKYCDFCNSELPDWKAVLTPLPGATAPAVMNVNFDNKTYSFQVAPGADGYRQFTEAIRKAFHLPDDSELNITFTCDEPSSGWCLRRELQRSRLVAHNTAGMFCRWHTCLLIVG